MQVLNNAGLITHPLAHHAINLFPQCKLAIIPYLGVLSHSQPTVKPLHSHSVVLDWCWMWLVFWAVAPTVSAISFHKGA